MFAWPQVAEGATLIRPTERAVQSKPTAPDCQPGEILVQRGPILVHQASIPVEQGLMLVWDGSFQGEQGSIHVQQGFIPVQDGMMLVEQALIDVEQGLAPVHPGTMLYAKATVPEQTGSSHWQQGIRQVRRPSMLQDRAIVKLIRTNAGMAPSLQSRQRSRRRALRTMTFVLVSCLRGHGRGIKTGIGVKQECISSVLFNNTNICDKKNIAI